jgi:hypothetical protein
MPRSCAPAKKLLASERTRFSAVASPDTSSPPAKPLRMHMRLQPGFGKLTWDADAALSDIPFAGRGVGWERLARSSADGLLGQLDNCVIRQTSLLEEYLT